MDNIEQDKSKSLLQEVKELGLIDAQNTIDCSNCRVVFPKEYEKCPQCNTIQIPEPW
ncbi:MAG: hypothetical protein ACO2Y5_00915 [Nitrosopumilaceae archaeon]